MKNKKKGWEKKAWREEGKQTSRRHIIILARVKTELIKKGVILGSEKLQLMQYLLMVSKAMFSKCIVLFLQIFVPIALYVVNIIK